MAIINNWELFHRYFNDDFWTTLRPMKNISMKSCYGTKKTFTLKKDMLLLGTILKEEFDYSCRTNVIDILFHFKRLYDKLKPIT